MIEGLALWALIIFLLVKVGMPWNKITKTFSVVGGVLWLLFVWIGLISWSPMDMTGGSVVQSPHIQLRPVSSDITGEIKIMHVNPNQKIKKGDSIYTLDTTQLDNKLKIIENKIKSAEGDLMISHKNLEISKKLLINSELTIKSVHSEIKNKKTDIAYFTKNHNKEILD